MTAITRPRHHADETADALYQAVVEYPFDTLARLVLADRLQELGEDERAEFIRIDCEPGGIGHQDASRLWHRYNAEHWAADLYAAGLIAVSPAVWGSAYQENARMAVIRNGFVSEVRCPLDWWTGGACGRCQGTGYDRRDLRLGSDCPDCHGTGRTPGHGAAVVARHPVTKVVCVGAEPFHLTTARDFRERWCWFGRAANVGRAGELPADVFDAVTGFAEFDDSGRTKRYFTREAAVEALSRALVDLAREGAGLPPITWEVTP